MDAQVLHDARQGRYRFRIMLDVGARHAQHDFCLSFIHRDIHAVLFADGL